MASLGGTASDVVSMFLGVAIIQGAFGRQDGVVSEQESIDFDASTIDGLRDAGHIKWTCTSSGKRGWQLTSQCIAQMKISNAVSEGSKVLEPRPVEVTDMTSYEVIVKLHDEGWTWKSLPQNAKGRKALPAVPTRDDAGDKVASGKIFYTSAVACRQYLQ